MEALLHLLENHRVLIVLDALERAMVGDVGMDAAYRDVEPETDKAGFFRCCYEPLLGEFLRRVAEAPLRGRVLFASRHLPKELERQIGCRREEIGGLDPKEAVAFFKAQNIRGAGKFVGQGRLNSRRRVDMVSAAYDRAVGLRRALLSRIAALRGPPALELFQLFRSDIQLDRALDDLVDRGPLFFDRDRGRYDLHPAVRQHAYHQLADRHAVHGRLREYFGQAPPPGDIRGLRDLRSQIEFYYHTARAGHYDRAYPFFEDRLHSAMHFHLKDHHTCAELLMALFPDGLDQPPRLRDPRAQERALGQLGHCFASIGWTRRAARAFALAVEVAGPFEGGRARRRT